MMNQILTLQLLKFSSRDRKKNLFLFNLINKRLLNHIKAIKMSSVLNMFSLEKYLSIY